MSAYEYITGDELEAFAINTYATTDATFTEAPVMAQVSQAERWVNEYCGQTFTGTIPDGVVFATLLMAKYLMDKQMVENKHIDEMPTKLNEIIRLCKEPLEKHKVDITYSGSETDFHLPTLRS